MVAAGTVVGLNRTSSAGKTSMAAAFPRLRADAGECWVVIALDVDGDRAHFHVGEPASLMSGHRRAVGELVHRFSAYDLALDSTARAVDDLAPDLHPFVGRVTS